MNPIEGLPSVVTTPTVLGECRALRPQATFRPSAVEKSWIVDRPTVKVKRIVPISVSQRITQFRLRGNGQIRSFLGPWSCRGRCPLEGRSDHRPIKP